MKIHKEGYPTLIIVFIFLAILNSLAIVFYGDIAWIKIPLIVLSVLFFFFFIYFFRVPDRATVTSEAKIIAPADGEVVVIEETFVEEYFNDKRLQISIFMSPFNVHRNVNPVTGIVKYFKYHKGKFYVAWLPKSSTENERTTYVIESTKNVDIMLRQVAGFVARRIVHYNDKGDSVTQGEEFGFIKFGSRVDIFLPIGTKVNVKLNQQVRGAQTILADI